MAGHPAYHPIKSTTGGSPAGMQWGMNMNVQAGYVAPRHLPASGWLSSGARRPAPAAPCAAPPATLSRKQTLSVEISAMKALMSALVCVLLLAQLHLLTTTWYRTGSVQTNLAYQVQARAPDVCWPRQQPALPSAPQINALPTPNQLKQAHKQPRTAAPAGESAPQRRCPGCWPALQ